MDGPLSSRMHLGHILLSPKLLVMPRRQFTGYGYLIESNPWAIIIPLEHCTTTELDSHAQHLETQESWIGSQILLETLRFHT
jgi:hypothetical protein